MDADYKAACERDAEAMQIVEREARRHCATIKASNKEQMKNGNYGENASLIVSIHASSQ